MCVSIQTKKITIPKGSNLIWDRCRIGYKKQYSGNKRSFDTAYKRMYSTHIPLWDREKRDSIRKNYSLGLHLIDQIFEWRKCLSVCVCVMCHTSRPGNIYPVFEKLKAFPPARYRTLKICGELSQMRFCLRGLHCLIARDSFFFEIEVSFFFFRKIWSLEQFARRAFLTRP